jgi:hypothetical protein
MKFKAYQTLIRFTSNGYAAFLRDRNEKTLAIVGSCVRESKSRNVAAAVRG